MLVQLTLLLTVLLSIVVVDPLTSLYILASMPVVYVRLEKKFLRDGELFIFVVGIKCILKQFHSMNNNLCLAPVNVVSTNIKDISQGFNPCNTTLSVWEF